MVKDNLEAARKARAFDAIAEILYPGGDLDHEWDVETIEQVAQQVLPFMRKHPNKARKPREE